MNSLLDKTKFNKQFASSQHQIHIKILVYSQCLHEKRLG